MRSARSNLTHATASRAWAWFCDIFGLDAWQINVCISDDCPDWAVDTKQMGGCRTRMSYRMATIWVSNSRSLADGEDPLSTFFHECMHILAEEAGIKGDSAPRREFVWNRAGDLLAKAFRAKVKP